MTQRRYLRDRRTGKLQGSAPTMVAPPQAHPFSTPVPIRTTSVVDARYTASRRLGGGKGAGKMCGPLAETSQPTPVAVAKTAMVYAHEFRFATTGNLRFDSQAEAVAYVSQRYHGAVSVTVLSPTEALISRNGHTLGSIRRVHVAA